MTERRLLTDEERRALLGGPDDADGLARLFTFTRSDRELVALETPFGVSPSGTDRFAMAPQ